MKKPTNPFKSSAPTTSSSSAPKRAQKPASAASKPFSELLKSAGAAVAAPQKTKIAPRVKPVLPLVRVETAAAAATIISAKIDIGFGNTLCIRGDGPGLSWDKGIPLDCTASDQWTISFKGVVRPIVFKLLINDERWSTGADFVAEAGQETALTPSF